ncbi:helix-turn-helix domain-containing protein [Aquimarina sp. AU474]|uniref:helix-turn-helix domain-containing protein n=1 Tax=Aquimarina sp. AU474 TaxID=2108529 RepID=UPI001358100D|nr:helix-turn-helix domain-containing protein [Aquimarina sp. AU474]
MLYISLLMMVVGIQYAPAQESKRDKIEEYIVKGKKLYYEEKYEKSIEYFNKTIKIARKLQDSSLISILTTSIGHAYVMNDQNQKALDAYYTSLELAKSTNNVGEEMNANSGLVLVYKKTKQYEKALQVSRQMLKSINNSTFRDTKYHVNIIATGSEVYLDTEKYDSVLHYVEQGIAISKSLDYKEGLVDLYIKKGMVFYHQEQYEEALTYLFKAEELLQQHEIKNKFYPTVNSAYFVASCYYKQSLYDRAIERLLGNIDAADQDDLFKLPVLQSHLLLANCYAEKEEYKNALYWNNAYAQLNEAFHNRKDKTVDKIYQNEAQVLEEGIAQLQQQQAQSERIKAYAYGIAIFLFALLLLGVFVYVKKQRANAKTFNQLITKIDILEAKEKEMQTKDSNTREIVIDDDKVAHVIKGLTKLESQEFYLRSDCNLRSVAKKVKTNATYLSKIINMHEQKNFNEYINDLRIDYALKRLKNDRKFRSFSIKSIATEIGYKSDYSFAKHFKSKTGLNPSYYIKNIEKHEKTLESMI